MALSRLIYISRPAFPIRPGWMTGQMGDILAQGRAHNTKRGITGILGVEPNRFFQIMEGAEADLRATYERIRADKRHYDIDLKQFEPITVRAFKDWAVGFATRVHLPPCEPLKLDFEGIGPETIVHRGQILRAHGTVRSQAVSNAATV